MRYIIIAIEDEPTYQCTYRTYSRLIGYTRCTNMTQYADDWCGAH